MDFFEYIDLYDIIFAGVVALVLTVFIKVFIIGRAFHKITFKNEGDILYIKHKGMNNKQTLNECKAMFPMDKFSFKGELFLRGDNVQVKTKNIRTGSEYVFNGVFMGGNQFETICILTKDNMVVCFTDSITEIKKI